jgi:KDO2-lipid IV(A) lauroyltransferase
MRLLARAVLALVWLVHWLPLSVQAALGSALGRLLYTFGRRRREVAQVNLALCLPERTPAERTTLAREHFRWLGRSAVERGLLWYAPPERLRRLIQVEGDVGFAERTQRPVMWLVPHFVGLDVAAAAISLKQSRHGVTIYQKQKGAYLEGVVRRGRTRFGRAYVYPRRAGIRPVIKHVREGAGFFNLPDMDFGIKDSLFAPFFGVPAATLQAPARLAQSLGMVVQPVVVFMLPGARGWRVEMQAPLDRWPSGDAAADAGQMNALIEQQVRRDPAQYLWVHKRFKTRPPGEPAVY